MKMKAENASLHKKKKNDDDRGEKAVCSYQALKTMICILITQWFTNTGYVPTLKA